MVWAAGTALTRYADTAARLLGWGQATAAILILAAVTSLPELAISLTAAYDGDAELAVNNLLGSIALQIVLLALADLVYHDRALTSIVPDPVVMLQGAICIALLAAAAAASLLPDILLLGAGAWSWALLFASLAAVRKITLASTRQPWIAKDQVDEQPTGAAPTNERPLPLLAKILLAAATILIGGIVVAKTGGAIARQTGLGSSFMGVAFVALATSLPEASTVFAAMRRGLYTMALSDILGTNIFNIALIYGIDIVDQGGAVLPRAGRFASLTALLGAVLTCLFLIGLLERRDRTIGRMGYDSFAVLLVYALGLAGLYAIRAVP